jgi:hypothetical protein
MTGMNSDMNFQPIPPKPATEPAQAPDLARGEKWLAYLTVTLLLAVGTLGLLASFQSVSATATRWGFETPQLLPISIDLAIPGFTIANLLLIRLDMELAWVRLVPWVLTYVTVYLNIQAGHELGAKIGHGALPLVWVVCSEIAGHIYRSKIGAVTGKRMERIRRARWFLAPLTTGSLWRRMVLWEETSYAAALSREWDRVLAHADLRETYGRFWRFKAPRRDRVLLRIGGLNPAGLVPTETTETTEAETETSLPALATTAETVRDQRETKPRDLPQRETETSPETADSVYETETGGLAQAETAEITRPEPAETSETETPKVSRPRTPKTETTTVSPIGDRNPETETNHLLGLMRDRGSATAVGLTEAITETGRPKATAAKRLKAARDLYRRETAA